jgi:FAD/FMN-containing dehydrogenase
MADITVAAGTALDSEGLTELREGFRGAIVQPEDPGYNKARAVFNSMFDRRPAAILRPTGTADVIRAIRLARLSGAPLAIRGAGHSVAGFSTCDDGIVIDMRELTGVRVDPEKRTASVQAGVDWGTLDRETQQFGLAVTGGRVTSTGVVGFTIGSGSGWLERRLGFACDSLIRADVVTADGDVVIATETENDDLLWGLSGGGGNFGVVTELEFRLHAVGPVVYAGLALFDGAHAREVITTWRDISGAAAESLGWVIASVCGPPEPFVPEEWRGKRMWAVLGLYAGSREGGARVMAPLRALRPIVDLWQPMPYTVIQGLVDSASPHGRRNFWRAHALTDLTDSAVDTLIEVAERMPSPFTTMLLANMAGAVARVSDGATPLGARSAPFALHLNAMWETADGDEDNIAWTRATTDSFAPAIVPGMALNFYTEIGDQELRDGFGNKLARLRALKDRYDRTNLFRLNQNITPS